MAFKIGNCRAVIERLGPAFLCEPNPTCLFQGVKDKDYQSKSGGSPLDLAIRRNQQTSWTRAIFHLRARRPKHRTYCFINKWDSLLESGSVSKFRTASRIADTWPA